MRNFLRSLSFFSRESLWYIKHKLTGSSYINYYAERMDRIIRRNPNWGLNLNKKFQLDYLKTHGLSVDMKFLDYGCGALAAGIHFIEYLEPSKYLGVDISKQVLDEGERRIQKNGLAVKKPRLHHIPEGSLDALKGERFDIIWAQSVLTHMPPDDIKRLFRNIRCHMNEKTIFYATVARNEEGIRQKRFKDWMYDVEFLRKESGDCGLHLDIMPDWKHPEDPAGKDTLMKLTLFKVS